MFYKNMDCLDDCTKVACRGQMFEKQCTSCNLRQNQIGIAHSLNIEVLAAEEEMASHVQMDHHADNHMNLDND